jgi:hypothetical protein
MGTLYIGPVDLNVFFPRLLLILSCGYKVFTIPCLTSTSSGHGRFHGGGLGEKRTEVSSVSNSPQRVEEDRKWYTS